MAADIPPRLSARLAEGPLSFAAYMAHALLDPIEGYYARGRRPGRAGDFVTAPEASDALGRALARPLAWAADLDPGWSLVELGPGTGRLLRDVLDALGEAAPGAVHAVDAARDALDVLGAALGAHAARLHVHRDVDALPALRGVVLANEFFDALPVHLLEWSDDGWREIGVAAGGGRLVDHALDPGAVALSWARRFAPPMEPGARFTCMLGLAPLLGALSARLDAGVVIVLDYGGASDARWGLAEDGTVRAFRGHAAADPWGAPGTTDITSDVNTTALSVLAREAGFDVAADVSQGAFIAWCGGFEAGAGARFVAHPASMGERFRAVVLSKGGWARTLGLEIPGGDLDVWERLAGGAVRGGPRP